MATLISSIGTLASQMAYGELRLVQRQANTLATLSLLSDFLVAAYFDLPHRQDNLTQMSNNLTHLSSLQVDKRKRQPINPKRSELRHIRLRNQVDLHELAVDTSRYRKHTALCAYDCCCPKVP